MKRILDLKNRRERRAGAIFLVAFVNFSVFFVMAMVLGGDALNGEHTDGHYFLSNHGHLREVSAAVFRYSQIHAGSILLTHVAAIVAVGQVVVARRKRSP